MSSITLATSLGTDRVEQRPLWLVNAASAGRFRAVKTFSGK